MSVAFLESSISAWVLALGPEPGKDGNAPAPASATGAGIGSDESIMCVDGRGERTSPRKNKATTAAAKGEGSEGVQPTRRELA